MFSKVERANYLKIFNIGRYFITQNIYWSRIIVYYIPWQLQEITKKGKFVEIQSFEKKRKGWFVI